jgi:hypothetical protein
MIDTYELYREFISSQDPRLTKRLLKSKQVLQQEAQQAAQQQQAQQQDLTGAQQITGGRKQVSQVQGGM